MSATTVRRGWTDWEYGVVFESDHMTAREIGEVIGRSEGAVWDMRRKLRNGWEPTRKATEEWTREEDAALIANPYLSAPKVAKLLSRSRDAVVHRRKTLRAQGISLPRSGNSSPFRPGARPMLAQTCPDCGLLLQAKWFMVVSGAWRKRCTRCHTAHFAGSRRPRNVSDQAKRSKESAQKYQALTLPGAVNNGNEYTEQDMDVLRDPDLTLFQKALMLKRSYLGVAGAAHRYGFPSAVGLGDPERDQWMIDNPNAKEYAA